MLIAFQVILLIVITLTALLLFSKDFDNEAKLQSTAMGVAAIVAFLITKWL